MYIPTIALTDEQRQIAEAKAHELGYAGPDQYLQDLLSDALEENTRPDVDDVSRSFVFWRKRRNS